MYKSTTCLIFLFLFFVSGLASDSEKIDSFIEPFAKANHFSGVVLASKDGSVFYRKAFGLANAEHNVANNLNTKFGIASITKPMTFVVLSRLIEEKKISLDDKLSKYIKGFPDGDKITIQMIAQHKSGISHRVMPSSEESKRYTPEQFVEKAKLAKLEFAPGSDELYSSAGYAVLARTLEIASGESFNELLRKHVFAPAGMNDTEDFDSRRIIDNKADCYLLGGKGFSAAPLKDYSFLVGAGSVFSTVDDIYKFGMAQIAGKYGALPKSTFVREGVFSSNGSTNGYRSNIRIDTEKKYGFVVVSNMASGANDLIINNLRALLEGKEMSSPLVPNPRINPSVRNKLSDYPGRYKLGGSGFDILIDGGELFAGPFKLLPMEKDKFYNFFGYAEVTFVRDEKGNVKGLEWVGSGGKSEWTRD